MPAPLINVAYASLSRRSLSIEDKQKVPLTEHLQLQVYISGLSESAGHVCWATELMWERHSWRGHGSWGRMVWPRHRHPSSQNRGIWDMGRQECHQGRQYPHKGYHHQASTQVCKRKSAKRVLCFNWKSQQPIWKFSCLHHRREGWWCLWCPLYWIKPSWSGLLFFLEWSVPYLDTRSYCVLQVPLRGNNERTANKPVTGTWTKCRSISPTDQSLLCPFRLCHNVLSWEKHPHMHIHLSPEYFVFSLYRRWVWSYYLPWKAGSCRQIVMFVSCRHRDRVLAYHA